MKLCFSVLALKTLRPSSLVTDCGGLDMWPHVLAMWQGIRITSERLPKIYSSGSRRTEKDPETELASLGLIVSRKITTLLLDVTPMSKI